MIQCEFQNIKEVEANKAYEASEAAVVPSLNQFLLNMLSDQVEVPVDFDSQSWSKNMPSEDTS